MYYAIYCKDQENSTERRRSVRAAHLNRLAQLKAQGRLLVAGPLLNEDHENPMLGGFKGSLIIAEFDNLAHAKEWAAADPYVTADVYAKVMVHPFTVALSQ